MVTGAENKPTPEPEPGDINVCFRCGGISVFTEGIMCRPPNEEERVEIEKDEMITTSSKFVKDMRRQVGQDPDPRLN